MVTRCYQSLNVVVSNYLMKVVLRGLVIVDLYLRQSGFAWLT